MRRNLPVTDIETLLPENQFIYSRTNLKGVITEVNQAFATISGFSREEMLQQPHNLIRHPDMPTLAFDDMWRDLKIGRPWRGLVKNRSKDGGFYWVIANVSPVREDGEIVGYQSVRVRPSRAAIEQTEAVYRRINRGDKSITIKHGRAVPTRTRLRDSVSSARVQLLGLGAWSLLTSLLALLNLAYPQTLFSMLLWGMAGGGAVWSALFLTWFAPKLFADLGRLSDHLESLLISGNLKTRFELPRRDQLGEISCSLDQLVSSLQATIQGFSDVALQVDTVAQEVKQEIINIDASAHIQTGATAATAAGIEEISVSISQIAGHVQDTHQAAAAVSQVSLAGAALSGRASDAIQTLAQNITVSAAQVQMLGQQSEEISRVTGVIKEIADQTNLLALNASIEAARAGEQGRGFAVVADEVRKLAERTGKATEEIRTTIAGIQGEIQQAVDSMQLGAEQVVDSVDLVHEVRQALENIDSQMGKTLEMMNDISHSSSEQKSAMSLMTQSVEKVSAMTEQNQNVVSQTSASVSQLERVVNRMRKSTTQYVV